MEFPQEQTDSSLFLLKPPSSLFYSSSHVLFFFLFFMLISHHTLGESLTTHAPMSLVFDSASNKPRLNHYNFGQPPTAIITYIT